MIMIVLIDNREPDPHPWEPYLPEGWRFEWGTLETGDLAVARLPDSIVIERKTACDLAGCIGGNRERFERELKRSRYCGRFLIVVEGSLADVIGAARGIHSNAVLGTVAAWSNPVLPDHLCRVYSSRRRRCFQRITKPDPGDRAERQIIAGSRSMTTTASPVPPVKRLRDKVGTTPVVWMASAILSPERVDLDPRRNIRRGSYHLRCTSHLGSFCPFGICSPSRSFPHFQGPF